MVTTTTTTRSRPSRSLAPQAFFGGNQAGGPVVVIAYVDGDDFGVVGCPLTGWDLYAEQSNRLFAAADPEQKAVIATARFRAIFKGSWRPHGEVVHLDEAARMRIDETIVAWHRSPPPPAEMTTATLATHGLSSDLTQDPVAINPNDSHLLEPEPTSAAKLPSEGRIHRGLRHALRGVLRAVGGHASL